MWRLGMPFATKNRLMKVALGSFYTVRVISRREPKVRFLSSVPGSWWHNERLERGEAV